ncbi:methyltransferase [Luedemannella helvata]|uniref:Methyltransferase n=1 Tax=Luedemannella helvata TaxID=349315 RepID=A0ABN2JWL7_9ACTN
MGQDDHGLASRDSLHLLRISEGFTPARAVQLAAELGLADLLADGPRGADELAAATSCHPGAVYRLLRALAAEGVFTETTRGRFALTPVGERLRVDHPQSLSAWVRFQSMFNEVYAAALHSVRTGEPAFPAVYGSPIFRYLEENPEQGALFNTAMAQHSRLLATVMAEAYDFSTTHTIVDVGGGDGSFLSGLLASWPDTSGVVYDLPYVADAARKQLASAGLGERCSFVGGDFLRDVPAGADAYVLKGVIHNWPDDQATTILRNCRQAMADGGRALLIEWLVPPGDTPHPSKLIDLSMLLVYGGRERTEQEYLALFADAGLRLSRVVAAAPLTVVEAVATR